MFYKFPSTPYIEADSTVKRSDKILQADEVEKILNETIYIEEKIDGANLGISFSDAGDLKLQNRGSYLTVPFEGQWKPLKNWLLYRESRIFDYITNRYILFGEWCYARHSIYYNALPDWFIGFDLYDKKQEKFLSVKQRNRLLSKMEIEIIPLLGQGIYSLEELPGFFGQSKYGGEKCEGIYIRQDQGNYLKYRAKMVRREFKQNITEHWSKGMLACNVKRWQM